MSKDTDVWQLGIVFYYIAYYEYPFRAKDIMGLIHTIKTKEIETDDPVIQKLL